MLRHPAPPLAVCAPTSHEGSRAKGTKPLFLSFLFCFLLFFFFPSALASLVGKLAVVFKPAASGLRFARGSSCLNKLNVSKLKEGAPGTNLDWKN